MRRYVECANVLDSMQFLHQPFTSFTSPIWNFHGLFLIFDNRKWSFEFLLLILLTLFILMHPEKSRIAQGQCFPQGTGTRSATVHRRRVPASGGCNARSQPGHQRAGLGLCCLQARRAARRPGLERQGAEGGYRRSKPLRLHVPDLPGHGGGAEWHDGDGTLPAGRRGRRGTRAVAAHRTRSQGVYFGLDEFSRKMLDAVVWFDCVFQLDPSPRLLAARFGMFKARF